MYNSPDLANAIKMRAKQQNVKVSDMLSACDLGINTLSHLNHGRALAHDSLAKIADYLDCSVDYLLGRTDDEHGSTPVLTAKDEKDIEKILQQTREQLESQDGLMFDGDPASKEAIDSILAAMELGLQAAKQRNKEKYTPKKYKK